MEKIAVFAQYADGLLHAQQPLGEYLAETHEDAIRQARVKVQHHREVRRFLVYDRRGISGYSPEDSALERQE